MKSIYEYPPPILQQMHRKETTNSGVSKVNAIKRDDCLEASDLNNAFVWWVNECEYSYRISNLNKN